MDYPSKPIVDETLHFMPEVVDAVNEFKRTSPYSRGDDNRWNGLCRLLFRLNSHYKTVVSLAYIEDDKKTSLRSRFIIDRNIIVMVGKLSLITFLHEYFHALGLNEHYAVKYSVSLFKKCFPEAYEKLYSYQHCLIEQKGGNNG
jgi:hypothetical protein